MDKVVDATRTLYPKHLRQKHGVTYLFDSIFKKIKTKKNTSTQIDPLFFFRNFLALKIIAPFAFPGGFHHLYKDFSNISSWLSWFFVIGIISFGISKFYKLGLLVVAGFAFYHIIQTLPFTINHEVLELVIVLLLILNPLENESHNFPKFSCKDMITTLMVSVWVYSGIQKIVHGYYLNGEFFALEFFSNESNLGKNIALMFGFIDSFFRYEKNNNFTLSCCVDRVIPFKTHHTMLLIGMSWLTIVVELFLPLTLYFKRTKSLGLICLFLFQASIGFFSGEIDFAFTVFGILLLSVPRISALAYPFLAALFLADRFLWTSPWY